MARVLTLHLMYQFKNKLVDIKHIRFGQPVIYFFYNVKQI